MGSYVWRRLKGTKEEEVDAGVRKGGMGDQMQTKASD